MNKSGAVTAADIELNHNVELVNPDQHICTLDKKRNFLWNSPSKWAVDS